MKEHNIRIVVLDYYMSPPIPGLDVVYSEFRASPIGKVPVLRCFGSMATGQKVCIHIHGVFPYIYIPYDGVEDVNVLMYQIASKLDKAVNVSMNQTNSNTQHVYKIQLVSGIPMYGYHSRKHQFLKIYLYNPLLITKVAQLLQNEQILGRFYQPHESHLNFTLQFMIDYNLHGMSFMKVSDVKFRGNPTDLSDVTCLPDDVQKISLCQLEGDVHAENILNRQEIVNGGLSVNPGIAAIWEDERQRRRYKNEDSQIEHCLKIERTNIPPTNSHLIYKKALTDRLAVLSTDKENRKDDINLSVYPAETPESSNIQNASIVDLHTPSSLEISLDESISLTQPTDNLNSSMDVAAQDLVDILENLENNVEGDLEEDCILSQTVNEEDDSMEEQLDMTIPLEALTTPTKIDVDLPTDEDSLHDADITLIPQLDGLADDESEWLDNDGIIPNHQDVITYSNHKNYDYFNVKPAPLEESSFKNYEKKKLFVKLKPLSWKDINMGSKTNEKCDKIRKQRKRKSENEKINLEIKRMHKQIKKNHEASKLKRMMKFISKKERKLSVQLNASKPKFNIVPQKIQVDLPMPLKYSLDGTVDSSSESSEDELPVKNRKTNMQEGRSPKYSTLPISVASSSHRKKSTGHGNIEDIDRSEKISKEKQIPESAVPTSTLPLKHCDIVKRNLFSSTSQHDLTEESIACTYSTSRESTIISFQPSNGSNSSSDNSTSNSQSDLFSPSVTQHNKSFFQKYNFKLSIASEASTSGTIIDNLNTTKKALVLSNKSSDSSNSESKSKDIANVIYRQYKTKSRAPTRLEVKQSLNDLNIAHVTKQEPFYSNVEDVTGAVEIGHNVLKIKSKTTADLSEFESVADGFNQFRKAFLVDNPNYNKSHIKNLMLSFYTDRKVIVAPVKKAPCNKEVRLWLTKNTRLSTPKQTKSKVNQKVHIPMSQNEYVADCDLSLSISSCTPIQSNSSMKSGKLYLRKSLMSSNDSHNQSCQITGVSNDNSYGFEQSVQNFRNAKAVIEHQYLTIMAIELHVHTRGSLKPNPELDAIRAIFYSISNDVPNNYPKPKQARGVLAVNNLPNVAQVNSRSLLHSAYGNYEVSYVDSEEELLTDFVKLLVYWDPDILAGYEIQMLSWGYLIERAYILNVNLLPQLGRSKISIRGNKENNPENIIGRIMLDVWRLMRHEIALQSYTFESIVYHILHKRVPFYSFKTLSFWWDHITNLYRHKTIQYYLFRVEVILELFDKLDLIGRTSELARLFGIQFYEVLSRGSQFRVESMMLRLAKPLNYIPVSPSVQQRAHMKAPEYIPLVMEPESKLYNDPIIVLDFQSLYPSIIIAYNYCFTTCVGRVECLGKNNQFEFGATNLKVAGKKVEKLVQKDLLNFSPCGVAFVKSKVRDGILPKMLREILDTRLMVKNSMKENKDDQLLQKVLHNRQLGLKLIANVTYGYTAANFSGRMCCVEVGDSVVSKGRETLQRAIAMVDNTPEWGARVVYGDTDSLFVLVAGRSRETAFEIGAKIADAVTKDNPDPVKLKLEKVYHPCILQTKKRYVGYMYESINQKEPVYDAKGIETVRRDGCPAVSKILEKCLRMLFETKDVSLIKKYVLRQFTKIVAGRANIQELTFAKEYRGASGYKAGACVPALELSKKWTAIDKRNEPRCGERVPYIIVNGPPGLPLIRLVRSPMDLLEDPSLRPNALYYITKVIIPPLNRCFGLIGCDVTQWFNQMPRKVTHVLPGSSPSKKSTISQYFATVCCASCNELTQKGLCETCLEHPQQTYVTLMEKTRIWEQNYNKTVLFCQSCTGCLGTVSCVSLDCPVLYRRIQTNQDLQQANFIRELLNSQDMLF